MKCPGQDMQYWKDDAIFEVKCPECQTLVEFYKDDTTRKCHKCSHRFVNPKMDFGCATYCQFADQCLGTLPEDFVMSQDSLLKDKVAVEMKRFFKSDFKRIRQATTLAKHAENIGKTLENVNLALILCSAYLITLDRTVTSEEFKPSSPASSNSDSVSSAQMILKKLKANPTLISQVCEIISNTTERSSGSSVEEAVVKDAYNLTLLEELVKMEGTGDKKISDITAHIATDQGRAEAERIMEYAG